MITTNNQKILMLNWFSIFNKLKISVDKNIMKKKVIDKNIINFRKHI
jgi:hypothetical protein